VRDLEAALDDIRDLERRRAELWQQAAHDLRGNLGVVSNVAQGLALGDLPEERREAFLGLLQNNVGALHRLLDDVTDLARLHAGQEVRRVAPFDAADVLRRLCDDPAGGRGEGAVPEGARRRDPAGRGRCGQSPAHRPEPAAQCLEVHRVRRVLVRWGDTVARDDGRWC
jgi:hypothetical protein